VEKCLGLEDKNDMRKIEADFEIQSIKTLGVDPVDASSLEAAEFQNVVNSVKSGEM